MPDYPDPILKRRVLQRRHAPPAQTAQAVSQVQQQQLVTDEQMQALLASLGQGRPGAGTPQGGDIGSFLSTMWAQGVNIPYGMGPQDPQYIGKVMGLSGQNFGPGARYGNVGPGIIPGTSNQAAERAARSPAQPTDTAPPGFQPGPRGDYYRTAPEAPPRPGATQGIPPQGGGGAQAQAGPPPTIGGPATAATLARLSTPAPSAGFNRGVA